MELTGGCPKPGSKEGRNAKSSPVQAWLLVEHIPFLPCLTCLLNTHLPADLTCWLATQNEDGSFYIPKDERDPAWNWVQNWLFWLQDSQDGEPLQQWSHSTLLMREAQSHLVFSSAQYNPEGHNSTDHKQCKIICWQVLMHLQAPWNK